MSHTVTVTRTTTTSSTTAVLLNIGYFKKPEGILKLLHVILGIIVVGILGHYISYYHLGYASSLATPELYFLIVASACLITSALLLLSCFISIATATILPKTIFELLFHGAAAILLVIGAAVYVSRVQENQRTVSNYNYRMAAGELVHFPILSFLLFVGASHYLHTVVARNALYVQDGMVEPGYGAKIFASIVGLVNSILYGVATFFSYRHYKSG